MKRKAIFLSLVIVSVLMLASIGYAAWVITSNTEDSKTGNFSASSVGTYAGDLDIKVLTQTVTGESQNYSYGYNVADQQSPTIVFGKAGTPSDPWLTANDVPDDSRVVYIKISFIGPASTFDVSNVFKIGGVEVTNQSTTTLAEFNKYIGAASFEDAEGTAKSDNNVTFTNNQIYFPGNGWIILKVTYNWGTLFAGQNAYTYFNAFDKSSTVVSSHTLFGEGTTFTITNYGANSSTTITKDVSVAGQFAEAALNALNSYTSATDANGSVVKFEVKIALHQGQ